MFTGLISAIGRIESVRPRGQGGATLAIRHHDWPTPLEPGESIAVQGVCLTVTSATRQHFDCDLLRETLMRSNLGTRRAGACVNLERALRAGDRLGGHLVSGHIDGQGTCRAIDRVGPDYAVTIQAERRLLDGLVPKGSIACDGISLTVATLTNDHFSVHVIPHTWKATTLQWLRLGDRINLETDILGKHAAKSRDAAPAAAESGHPLTVETLRRSGFDV